MRQPPAQHENREKDAQIMWKYYESPPLQRTNRSLSLVDLIESLQDTHDRRLNDLDKAPAEARSSYWYPFVQHKHIKKDTDIMVIDSAYKDCFTVQKDSGKTGRNLQDVFDGSASWWTQCLGHGNVDLALAAAYAAGRYGHVIFPTATHEPAQKLTRTLLNTVGQYWADRVFFSDDGSTAMEVALKMALKHTSTKIKNNGRGEPLELSVLGLKGSYHGDTIGVMDASEPSVYNKSVEWYRGRGFWLDVPTVQMKDGQVKIQFPTEEWGVEEPEWTPFTFNFNTLSDVYDIEARLELQDRLYGYYYNVIHKLVQAAQKEHNLYFGALVMEPLVIGAGGMHFVDPFFQKALIDFARDAFEESLPVIFDEVFVGLYRLGVQSSTSVLGCTPDIACYAKILTGGLLPMSVTLATNEVFSSFLGDKKQDALLHGHSYTAQPVGCAVANKTMDLLQSHDARNPEWLVAKSAWAPTQYECLPIRIRKPTFFTLWDREFINKVSYLPNVESVMTMGTVLKISLVDQENAGTALPRIGHALLLC